MAELYTMYTGDTPVAYRYGEEWEADICLNCTKSRCSNCLSGKSLEEKEEMLRNSGGKKWLD